jgi:glycosyltransferase involved in cell wall biosynthesis
MKKLKIMWLHSHLSIPSGGTKYILEVIRELSKNHSVDLYVQKATPQFEQLFKKAGINITTMSKYSTSDVLFWFNFSRHIKNQINFLQNQAKNYDVVISSMFPMNIIANSLNLPHLQSCFQPFAFFWDPLMIEKLPILKRLFLYFLRSKFGKLDIDSTNQSSKILTINNGSKNSISQIYHKDSIPTFMGVDVHEVNLEIEKKYVGKKIILHSTDWTPLKKTSWLIQQFRLIQKKYPNVVLLITEPKIDPILKRTELEKIKKDAIENIEFLGTVPSDVLLQYYALADMVVYPGFGSGITTSLFVLECMAYETPAIVSNAASEDVENGKTGLVFNTDDEFQKCILTLLSNDDMRLTIGKQARTYVLQKHSWPNVAKIFETQCLEIIEK